MKRIVSFLFIIMCLGLTACGGKKLRPVEAESPSVIEETVIGGADGPTGIVITEIFGDKTTDGYQSINMEKAKEFFQTPGGYIIVDVRRADEFARGHIPGAINIANESIGSVAPAELPDKNQLIFVYCRSGRRSKEASKKLAAIGYENIVECGGILDWTGEIEK